MDIEIGETNENGNMAFVRYWEDSEFLNSGIFTITADKVIWNEEKGTITFMNTEEEVATTFWASHHADAKFIDSVPDGIRAIRAIARMANLTGNLDVSSIVDETTDGVVLTVENTPKGRLFTTTSV